MKFCSQHRLPENHNCPFDLNIRNFIDNSSKNHILYQDALDFMATDLTVAKIYEYVTTKKLKDSEAIDLLIYFIENSEDNEIRKNSIIAFKLLNLKTNKVYNILENLVLSEENQIIIQTAIDIISKMFPKKSRTLLKWIEKSKKDLNGKNR
jgi:hypothetical protein